MTHSRLQSVYFEKIDIIRFVAAFMVICYHVYQAWVLKWGFLPSMTLNQERTVFSRFGGWLHQGLMNGGFGVDIFFTISGFLITYLLLQEKEINGGRIDIKKFYIRRSLRIWPLYYLAIAISPFLITWVQEPGILNYKAHLLFYSNFDIINRHEWAFPLAHFWSLCTEEHFYIVWPIILAFVPNKRLWLAFSVTIILSIISRAYFFVTTESSWFPLYLHTLCRMDAIVIGSIVALIHFKTPIKLNIPVYIRLITYLVFIVLICIDNITQSQNLFSAMFKKYVYLGIALFAFLNFLFNDKEFFGLMNNKFFLYLGKISFGVYVYGPIFLEILIRKIMVPNHILNIYFYWFFAIAGSILIPIISYELFEKQFLKLKKRFEVVRIIKP